MTAHEDGVADDQARPERGQRKRRQRGGGDRDDPEAGRHPGDRHSPSTPGPERSRDCLDPIGPDANPTE